MSDDVVSDLHIESKELAEMSAEASAALKASAREQLQNDIEAFLARGGAIKEIAPNIVADPPKRPESNYGGQPI